jgi:alkylation response protein AidB-like acyl-CoA dehydrogenase
MSSSELANPVMDDTVALFAAPTFDNPDEALSRCESVRPSCEPATVRGPLRSLPPLFDGSAASPLARAALTLARQRPDVERRHEWPEHSWRSLATQGVLRWNIPVEYNGAPLPQRDLLAAYIELASHCLTTTFVLSQRNSACQKIVESSQDEVKERLLPPIAAGELLVTLGVSHLTTSRQHQARPAVMATPRGTGWVLDGSIPWVTAAPRADLVVAGGTCADGKQILVLLPTDARGVHVHAPQPMMGLNGSLTTSITLDGVEIPARYVLAGPVDGVLKRGGGAGNWATSALAIGLAKHACRELLVEAETRRDLVDHVAPLVDECESLERSLLVSAVPPAFPLDAARLRTEANSLVTRATQAWLAACKGAAYLADHPAATAVQQAMFFFVWSCPQPVLMAALRELSAPRR